MDEMLTLGLFGELWRKIMIKIMRRVNIRFVWGALAEDNGNHLDPGDRGILR